jgi:hypothetical protein
MHLGFGIAAKTCRVDVAMEPRRRIHVPNYTATSSEAQVVPFETSEPTPDDSNRLISKSAPL